MKNEDFLTLWNHFDKDKSGAVSMAEFEDGLRGEVSAARWELVKRKCSDIFQDESTMTLNDLLDNHFQLDRNSSSPLVRRIAREFPRQARYFFQKLTGDHDPVMTEEILCEYYGRLSPAILDAETFMAVLENSWIC